MDRKRLLKIKLKSLAVEAGIIRHEERKLGRAFSWTCDPNNETTPNGDFNNLRNEMAEHRRGVVRSEARHTHLAYGFLRGRAYLHIEPGCQRQPDWARVEAMVRRYGDGAYVREHWAQWLQLAKACFVDNEAVAA